MKNITLRVEEDVLAKVRRHAEERDSPAVEPAVAPSARQESLEP
jgi:hypothetical protein